jgi:hypothetical protein
MFKLEKRYYPMESYNIISKKNPEWQRKKESFIPKKIKIKDKDGNSEIWEFENSKFGETYFFR